VGLEGAGGSTKSNASGVALEYFICILDETRLCHNVVMRRRWKVFTKIGPGSGRDGAANAPESPGEVRWLAKGMAGG
jgi:hypothetical protein